MSFKNTFLKNHYILYGIGMAVILLLLKWLQWHFLIINHAYELYIGIIAIIFMLLGIWLAMKLSKPKTETVIIEKEIFINPSDKFIRNDKAINNLGLSKRELDVLELMSEGLSNEQIAGQLYVSINTIKTHSKNLFEKMDVQRRTQAIDQAKKLGIIP